MPRSFEGAPTTKPSEKGLGSGTEEYQGPLREPPPQNHLQRDRGSVGWLGADSSLLLMSLQ